MGGQPAQVLELGPPELRTPRLHLAQQTPEEGLVVFKYPALPSSHAAPWLSLEKGRSGHWRQVTRRSVGAEGEVRRPVSSPGSSRDLPSPVASQCAVVPQHKDDTDPLGVHRDGELEQLW